MANMHMSSPSWTVKVLHKPCFEIRKIRLDVKFCCLKFDYKRNWCFRENTCLAVHPIDLLQIKSHAYVCRFYNRLSFFKMQYIICQSNSFMSIFGACICLVVISYIWRPTFALWYASQTINFPSCEALTKCWESEDQCNAYILPKWPRSTLRGRNVYVFPRFGTAADAYIAKSNYLNVRAYFKEK